MLGSNGGKHYIGPEGHSLAFTLREEASVDSEQTNIDVTLVHLLLCVVVQTVRD